jgi:hypothetical protein
MTDCPDSAALTRLHHLSLQEDRYESQGQDEKATL